MAGREQAERQDVRIRQRETEFGRELGDLTEDRELGTAR
jgi:hypothetical protein